MRNVGTAETENARDCEPMGDELGRGVRVGEWVAEIVGIEERDREDKMEAVNSESWDAIDDWDTAGTEGEEVRVAVFEIVQEKVDVEEGLEDKVDSAVSEFVGLLWGLLVEEAVGEAVSVDPEKVPVEVWDTLMDVVLDDVGEAVGKEGVGV